MRLGLSLIGAAALGLAFAIAAPDARACGGCFPPPGENQSVVTDHRMILSVSKTQTTLYDQIQYSGEPSSFAWVLPISGTVTVGLSADTLFGALGNLTTTVVQQPPDGCPPPPNCGYGADEAQSAGSSGGLASPTSPPAVDVLKRETVGPYETVQLRSTDAKALENWLVQNGFAIPEDVKPVIAAYVREGFDFLALKLLPGKGVQTMRPVRISSQGASAKLPLRMVAAGTGAVVGITLWVIGEGRYEPQSFPSFVITDRDLVWDWSTRVSNYKELRAQKSGALQGRGWEIETALKLSRFQLESIVTNLARANPQVGADYAPVTSTGGQITKTADEVRQEDLKTLFEGIPDGQERVTRMRADLVKSALGTDLALVASGDQSDLPQVRTPKGEKNQPQCTIYNGCDSVGQAPRDEAIARSDNGKGESFACATAQPSNKGISGTSLVGVGSLAALLGLVLVRARRLRGREDDSVL